MSTLEKAIAIAAEAHAGQIDKAGAIYILHPLRVMLGLSELSDRIVGVLHDVVEDCGDKGWTLSRLQEEGFSNEIISALDSVTRREGEDYKQFVERASRNPIGRRVKHADLIDNCDLTRVPHPSPQDYERMQKYQDAISYIQNLIDAE